MRMLDSRLLRDENLNRSKRSLKELLFGVSCSGFNYRMGISDKSLSGVVYIVYIFENDYPYV